MPKAGGVGFRIFFESTAGKEAPAGSAKKRSNASASAEEARFSVPAVKGEAVIVDRIVP
jgi:hypothetical protein